MKKEMIITAVLVLFLCSCDTVIKENGFSGKDDFTVKQDSSLNEFQQRACYSAQKAENCGALAELELVTKEECCNELKKCCE